MRSSKPMACARSVTSAPAASQTSDTALIKEILVAKNALADTLTSSAVGTPMTSRGLPAAMGRA